MTNIPIIGQLDTQTILFGAVFAASVTLLIHLLRESRVTVAVMASIFEALESAAPVIVLIMLSTAAQSFFRHF